MPSYLGDRHHVSTSLICASYRSSSAAPAFLDSGRSWNASLDGAAEKGFAGACAMLRVVEMQRRAMAGVAVGRRTGVLRETARVAALRNIVADLGMQQLGDGRRLRPVSGWVILSVGYSDSRLVSKGATRILPATWTFALREDKSERNRFGVR